MMVWSDNLLLAGLLAATILALLLLAVVIGAARRDGDAPGGAKAGMARRLLGAESLRLSFRKAVKLIEKNLATRGERYNLSWTLLLSDGEPLPLQASGLRSALSADASYAAATGGVAWNFFDNGIVVQLRSDFLGAPDDAAGGVWDDFLGLCRAYRPQRPFDAIVLAIPCAALLQDTAEGQLALVARAKAIHRRLWLAQNRLALRFPIHVVVSECETLPGFADFGAVLAEPLRRAMLGWASPHELVAPYRASWIDAALDGIVGSVAGACDELCALEPGENDSSAYLLLPGELERLRAGLKLFCDELMRPSAYHESFLLRGVYLTGDASPVASLAPGAPHLELPGHEPMPVFLRDIFERKIFVETGLVRTSRQRMRHAAGTHLGWWAGLAVCVVWGCGLVVASWQLHARQVAISAYLKEIEARPTGAAPDGVRSSRRVMAALAGFDALGGAPFYSVLMPGSWPIVDDLNTQLQEHLEQAFADNAVAALYAAARMEAGRLTGVGRDPSSGAMLENGQCTLPDGWTRQVAAGPPAGLDLKSLPEYRAMMAYLNRLDNLARALSALQRLARVDGGAPAGPDLVQAVRLLLNKELHTPSTRTAALFRAAAQEVPMPSIPAFEQAARCSLRLASGAMYRRLFDQNSLLRTEAALTATAARLRDGAHDSTLLGEQLPLWLALRDAFDEQARQLVSGQGAWIWQRMFNLGSAQDDVLGRIGANRLLGAPAVQDVTDLAAQGLGRFLPAWDNAMTGHSAVDGSAGLVWSGTAWAFTPQRKDLHDAVAALVALPYMKAVAPAGLPLLPSGATVGWDRGQLERAAGLAEMRKAFLAGPYADFPLSLQEPAAALVDLALATSAHAALAQAISAAPPQSNSVAGNADRALVQRILAWLDDIGAQTIGAALREVLAHDALVRLTRLDDDFQAAQVYLPPDATFQDWQGGKGAMQDVFGGGDAAGLAAYLEQQQQFIDTIVGQAEGILSDLAGAGPAAQPMVARWQALAADLRRYRLKSPTSSRMALETFIVTGSADIDLSNCVDKLTARRAARRGADLFGERLQLLQTGLLARCRQLADGDDRRRWQDFAAAYNRELGVRAPFSATSGALPADRDSVNAVMALYERARAASALAARDPAGAGARAEVRRADAQLRRVRDLLAPLYPADEAQAGGLDVAVEFRANTAAEVRANTIIDWSLRIGTASLRLGEAPRALRWEPGMPVRLSLRLARDGVVAPKVDPGRPGMQLDDRTVSFSFDDPWALLTFINAHRESDAPGDDGRASLLRFEFPLVGVGAGASLPPEARARVFLRLRVSPPGKSTPLAWPAAFPAQVPLWQEPMEAAP